MHALFLNDQRIGISSTRKIDERDHADDTELEYHCWRGHQNHVMDYFLFAIKTDLLLRQDVSNLKKVQVKKMPNSIVLKASISKMALNRYMKVFRSGITLNFYHRGIISVLDSNAANTKNLLYTFKRTWISERVLEFVNRFCDVWKNNKSFFILVSTAKGRFEHRKLI